MEETHVAQQMTYDFFDYNEPIRIEIPESIATPTPTLMPTAAPTATATPTPTPTPYPPSAGIHTPDDLRRFLGTWPEDLKLIVNEDVVVQFCTPNCIGFLVWPARIHHVPSMSLVYLGVGGEVIPGPKSSDNVKGSGKVYKSDEGAAALGAVLADQGLMGEIRSRIEMLWEGVQMPTPTPIPCLPEPPESPATPDKMRAWLDSIPDELKLWVDEDVLVWFYTGCGSVDYGYPVFFVHLPSLSVVKYGPRGFGGYEFAEYVKDYKTEEAEARLDELLRDEELEWRIRERLGELEGLVWAQFDKAVALEDATEVLFQVAKRILKDHNYAEDACVVVHTNWMKNRITDWRPMNTALVDGFVSRLRGRTTYEVYPAEGHASENPCRKQPAPWYLYFERLSAWDNKLHVPVSVGCGINCWGNGGATYIFHKEYGQWQWESTTGVWMD